MEKAYFTKIRKELILALLSSETDIQIAVAWFTSEELFDQLIYLLKDGVKITLIIIDDFINNGEFGLDFQHFIDCGGKLFYGKAENPMHPPASASVPLVNTKRCRFQLDRARARRSR